jgi:hypothetical protein
MTRIDDIKSCIQELMADAATVVELARTYTEARIELERQLEYLTRTFLEEQSDEH